MIREIAGIMVTKSHYTHASVTDDGLIKIENNFGYVTMPAASAKVFAKQILRLARQVEKAGAE